ncbi:hypothetical protein [Parvicella tangerina]|uniref:Uncharacterized protein n=1 Tax=Parvicella tangerina TaxID=2829795 RepID=A0A916JML3_9FLAO|nr:hypothetical protein [Parvicella tangerina]CAG5083266.1 hypothetical protein CRYO30217_02143 [Parvicella tangerina]
MFEERYSYHLNNPVKVSEISINGELKSEIYRVRTIKGKKVYFIKLDIFHHDVFFIKFYLKKDQNNKNKFKIRYGNVKELTRLVSTCLVLANRKLKQNPDSIFAFHGQWDEKDVQEENVISQRYRIYKRVIASKVDENKYKFYLIDRLNSMAVIPVHLYNEKNLAKINKYFNDLYGETLEELIVPTIEEYNQNLMETET